MNSIDVFVGAAVTLKDRLADMNDRKRHYSQLYYDGLLLSNMCYYSNKHYYKAINTRNLSLRFLDSY